MDLEALGIFEAHHWEGVLDCLVVRSKPRDWFLPCWWELSASIALASFCAQCSIQAQLCLSLRGIT